MPGLLTLQPPYLDELMAADPIAPPEVWLDASALVLVLALRAARFAALAEAFSSLDIMRASAVLAVPPTGEGLTLSLLLLVAGLPVLFGAAALASFMPGAAIRAVLPLPAVGLGVTLSFELAVPGVMVALFAVPELLLASAPARPVAPVPPMGAGDTASLELLLPGGVTLVWAWACMPKARTTVVAAAAEMARIENFIIFISFSFAPLR